MGTLTIGTFRPRFIGVALASLALVASFFTLASTAEGHDVTDGSCRAAFGSGRISTDGIKIDKEAGEAKVTFKLSGSGAVCELMLVSYDAPSANFTRSNAQQQRLHDSDSDTVTAGTHTFTVDLPRQGAVAGCYWQVDFVLGDEPIRRLGPADSDNFYHDQGRAIDHRNGGSGSCAGAGGNQPGRNTPSPSASAKPTTPGSGQLPGESNSPGASPDNSAGAAPGEGVLGGRGTPSAAPAGGMNPGQGVLGGRGSGGGGMLPDTSSTASAPSQTLLVGSALLALISLVGLGIGNGARRAVR